jgi:hypothetical protein
LLLITIGVIALFVKKYLPAYVAEKGKNLATKEDIAGITSEIEKVKSEYARSIEILRSELRLESSLKEAFRNKCLQAIESINEVLVNVTKYCWSELAKRSPNEHYVWGAVDDTKDNWGFHYFRVALDKSILENELYLSEEAIRSLRDLSDQIGMLSSMELALSADDPDPAVIESAEGGYSTGLDAVRECRLALFAELRSVPASGGER